MGLVKVKKLDEKELVFSELGHTYTYKNKLVESVTTLIGDVLDDFSKVSKQKLEYASYIGKQVHKFIELEHTRGIDLLVVMEDPEVLDDIKICIGRWLYLKEELGIVVKKSEQKTLYEINGLVVAGTLDMYCDITKLGLKNVLIDIKTTSVLDKEKVAIQNTFYSIDNPKQLIGVIHLDKRKPEKSNLYMLERNEQMVYSLVEIEKYKLKKGK